MKITFVTADQIAANCGLTYPTVKRYLRQLAINPVATQPGSGRRCLYDESAVASIRELLTRTQSKSQIARELAARVPNISSKSN
jgi:hypothetical protein